MKLFRLTSFFIACAFSQIGFASSSTMPTPGSPKTFAAPKIEVTTLKEGIQLTHIQNKTTPLTRMAVIAWNGVGSEGATGEAGLSSLSADLLLRATKSKTTDEVMQAFQRLAADIQTSTLMDHTQLGIDVLSETLAPTLKLLDSLLINDTLNADDLERVRRKHLQALIQEADQPRTLAVRKFFEVVYEGHPMQRWRSGEEADITTLEAKRIQEWQRTTWSKTAMDIVVVSSLSLAQVKEALLTNLSQTLAAHTGTSRPTIAPLTKPKAASPKLIWVDKPGASQSVLMLGKALDKPSNEREARELGNDVLGGQFSARINLNLREDKGYTYGAYSRILNYQHGSTFYASTSVRADVTAASLTEMLKEVREIKADKPVSEREFKEVQTSAVLKWPSQFSPGSRLVYALVGLLREGHAPTTIVKEAEELGKVNMQEAQTSLNALLNNDYPWTLIVVGDAAKWKKSVEALNWESLL